MGEQTKRTDKIAAVNADSFAIHVPVGKTSQSETICVCAPFKEEQPYWLHAQSKMV